MEHILSELMGLIDKYKNQMTSSEYLNIANQLKHYNDFTAPSELSYNCICLVPKIFLTRDNTPIIRVVCEEQVFTNSLDTWNEIKECIDSNGIFVVHSDDDPNYIYERSDYVGDGDILLDSGVMIVRVLSIGEEINL